jgi:hypothetical protein
MLIRSLRANAAFSAASGLVLVLGSSILASPFGVPQVSLIAIGAMLLPFAAFVWWVSTAPRRGLVALIIAADIAWVVSAIALITGSPQALSTHGVWALIVASIAVADLAIAQGVGLRRTRT